MLHELHGVVLLAHLTQIGIAHPSSTP
jgi:hypothetical protein